jgi:predicted glycosyltransferase
LGAPEDREACRWRGGRGLRFIFYANELIGLGQLRHTLALAGRLSGSAGSPSSLILTGSPIEPNFQMPPRVDTVKLPGRSRDESGPQHSARLELDTDELRSLRSSIALAAATGFQPDVAVVDKLPLGHAGELAPTLEALRRSSDCNSCSACATSRTAPATSGANGARRCAKQSSATTT